MIATPFLTEIDPRSAVRGSRDPLGAQPVWSSFGRRIVGNLTTVSTSVRDFTVALLGYHFIERAEEVGYQGSSLDLFMRWEQLASYARAHVLEETGFRGTDRVHRNLAEDSRVILSAESAHQILGSQKIYGIWGLYSVPARTSGLLELDRPRLTAAAREHAAEAWMPVMVRAGARVEDEIVRLLAKPRASIDCDGQDGRLLTVTAALLGPRLRRMERDFYRAHLAFGGPFDATKGLQRQLVELMGARMLPMDERLSPSYISALAKDARATYGHDSALADHLERIGTIEPLLATCTSLFSWLLTQDGGAIGLLSKQLRREWGGALGHLDATGIAALEPQIAAATNSAGDSAAAHWIASARALACGAYADAITALVDLNGRVMRVRDKSAPWLELGRDARLKVRFHDERSQLPAREELPKLWRYSYFLDALRQIARAVGGNAS